MHSGNSIIIHSSAIIQYGLKNILLARNIAISVLCNTLPECELISTWKNMLIFADTRFTNELKKQARVLTRNGNTIIGIDTTGLIHDPPPGFDDILGIDDHVEVLYQKINDYLSKVSAVKSDNQLSGRETEILTMVAQGLNNKQIAGRLFISIHTVITHRKNITYKLGIKSIPGLTLYAALNNLVDFQR